MRYITGTSGYVKEVSFGADIACGDQVCEQYTGSVPEGYTSLEAWYLEEVEKLYRWKITDGQLTLDTAALPPTDEEDAGAAGKYSGDSVAITVEDKVIKHRDSGVTAGTYGGYVSDEMYVPIVTVDARGHVTKVLTANVSKKYLPLAGGTMTGSIIMEGTNPHVDFKDTSGLTAYVQTYSDGSGLKAGFGYGWANSLKIDSDGDVQVPGGLTADSLGVGYFGGLYEEGNATIVHGPGNAKLKLLETTDNTEGSVLAVYNTVAKAYKEVSVVGHKHSEYSEIGHTHSEYLPRSEKYVHPTSGATAGNYGSQTGYQLGWGGTISVPGRIDVDANGHITYIETHDWHLPNDTATTSKSGLMSSTDKTRLDSLNGVYRRVLSLAAGATSASIEGFYTEELDLISYRAYVGNTPVLLDCDESGQSLVFSIAQAYTADITIEVYYTDI